ncbi:hypothetical protein AEA01_17440 [Xanthomonas campestris pv. campestris]|nr:hypothetical protein AEA01_17440 [Xanthomonas campestris pv. campestris]
MTGSETMAYRAPTCSCVRGMLMPQPVKVIAVASATTVAEERGNFIKIFMDVDLVWMNTKLIDCS